MTQVQIDAVRKLQEEDPKGLNGQQDFLKNYVRKVLCDFSEQSAEFAGAVLSGEKTLSGCLKSFSIPAGREVALSDLAVYKMAAQYYIPDAEVEFVMRIRVPNSQTSAKILNIRFEDLLDF